MYIIHRGWREGRTGREEGGGGEGAEENWEDGKRRRRRRGEGLWSMQERHCVRAYGECVREKDMGEGRRARRRAREGREAERVFVVCVQV